MINHGRRPFFDRAAAAGHDCNATTARTLCDSLGSMAQYEKLVRLQCQLRVCLSIVVGELDLIGTIQEFHHRANLATHELVLWQIGEESYNVE